MEAGVEQRGEHAVTGAPASLGACTSPTASEGAASDGAQIGYLKDDKEPVVLQRLTGRSIKSK